MAWGDTQSLGDAQFAFQGACSLLPAPRGYCLQSQRLTEEAGLSLRNLYSHRLLTGDAVHNNGLLMLSWLLLRMTSFISWGVERHRKRADHAREDAAAGP